MRSDLSIRVSSVVPRVYSLFSKYMFSTHNSHRPIAGGCLLVAADWR